MQNNAHKSWLLTCPAGDGNFKIHLKEASDEDIKAVLSELNGPGTKTKIKALTAELNSRRRRGK